MHRVVFYWTFITLGGVLGFSSITLFSTASIVRGFKLLPFGSELTNLYLLAGPLFSFVLVVALLYGFYRMIPNTRVNWRPALVGALAVAILLVLNNYLSFVYVQRVISQGSLYGSVGIIPVLMVGLYIFWFFVLIGGQITYSVQNADTLTHREAWNNISDYTRLTLSLAAFIIICRRFKECLQPPTAEELSSQIRAPGHILNECLSRLSDLRLVNSTAAAEDASPNLKRYQPARPLSRITLGEFRAALEHYGNDDGAELLHDVDPVIELLRAEAKPIHMAEHASPTFDQLISESGAAEPGPGSHPTGC